MIRTTDSLLLSLGFPEAGPEESALHSLHAGTAFHQLAVIADAVESYAGRSRLALEEIRYLELLRRPLRGEPPRVTAGTYYRAAVGRDAGLAEAWFNLGRLLQDFRDADGALAAFDRCVTLSPHPRAQPHAHLHANAHWHSATLHEDAGRDEQALERYRQAVSLCDTFGVHHVRYARFLRRQGRVEESIPQFEKMMVYSHRYFTEFVLPPLQAPAPAHAEEMLDKIYETSGGDAVVFWENAYYRIPRTKAPLSRTAFRKTLSMEKTVVARLLARLGWKPSPQKSAAISDFE